MTMMIATSWQLIAFFNTKIRTQTHGLKTNSTSEKYLSSVKGEKKENIKTSFDYMFL